MKLAIVLATALLASGCSQITSNDDYVQQFVGKDIKEAQSFFLKERYQVISFTESKTYALVETTRNYQGDVLHNFSDPYSTCVYTFTVDDNIIVSGTHKDC